MKLLKSFLELVGHYLYPWAVVWAKFGWFIGGIFFIGWAFFVAKEITIYTQFVVLMWAFIAGNEIGKMLGRDQQRLEDLNELGGLTRFIKYQDHTGRWHQLERDAPREMMEWSPVEKDVWIQRAKEELKEQAEAHLERLRKEDPNYEVGNTD
jgi:hypothetical protein